MSAETIRSIILTVQVDVWSDFVCPWCYAAALSLRALKETHDVSIRWRSFELRPAGSPPMPESYRQQIETVGRPRFNQMMYELYGVEVNGGPFGINSRDALVGEKVAQAYGVHIAYREFVTRAYWHEAKDISDRALLRQIAETVGMDGEEFLGALDDPTFDEQVEGDVRLAQEIGLTGVPAQVFAGRYLVSGAQPVEVLQQVVDRILAISP